jgi:hypothetical protein
VIALTGNGKASNIGQRSPHAQAPFREPRTTVTGTEGKSQWDDALAVIKAGTGHLEWKKKPTRAIRIDGDEAYRKALKATLQTMGRKRGCVVEVLDDGQSVVLGPSSAARHLARVERPGHFN